MGHSATTCGGQPLHPVYQPTVRRALPGTGEQIGIAPQFDVDVGLTIKYRSGNTSGGGLINRTLAPFGYRARAEGLDGDHIVEMQIGGPNELPNLWPLGKSENRASGSLLKHAIDRAKDRIENAPRRNATINRDSFYIMIAETRQE